MRKKLTFIIPIFILTIISIVLTIKTIPTDSLSQNEIEQLRTMYPINDSQPENIDAISVTLEDCIKTCDCYVEVEVISKPTEFIKSISIDSNTSEGALYEKAGGLTEFNFVKCEVRVIDDAFDNIKQNTIEITYNSLFDVAMPSLDVGSRFIVGGVYNNKTDSIDIGSETIFYVTDDDYVLSLKSEASKNRHTGMKKEALFDYLQNTKKEITTK